jgi:hypothetical protein
MAAWDASGEPSTIITALVKEARAPNAKQRNVFIVWIIEQNVMEP